MKEKPDTGFWRDNPLLIPVKPVLIGFCGLARTGKDTAVQFMQTYYGGVRVAFADPLKEGLKVMLGLTDEDLNFDELKDAPHDTYGISPRKMMQTLGTEWGRVCVAGDVWLRVAGRRIQREMDDGRNVYVSDVRFPNEAEFIRSMGGKIFHILRPGAKTVASHISEVPMKVHDGDVVVVNDGSISDLFESLIEAKESIE